MDLPTDESARSNDTIEDSLKAIADIELRRAVLSLFDRVRVLVDTGEADVCILAARRLSCLYLLLRRAGMQPLPGVVLSDKAFDFESQRAKWGPDSKIVLVDDTLTLGSSLAYLKNKLSEHFAPDNIQAFVICKDETSANKSLIAYLKLRQQVAAPRERVEAFSVDIAKCLFAQQVPYFSDFPVTQTVRLPASSFASLLADPRITCADVTSSLLAARETASYSLWPCDTLQQTLKQTCDRWVPGLGSLVQLAKIRVYSRARNLDFLATFVPIVILRPIASESLQVLTSGLAELGDADITEVAESASLETRYRAVQALISTALLHVFWREFSAISGPLEGKALKWETEMSTINFGVAVATFIRQQGTRRGKIKASVPSDDRKLTSRILAYPDVKSKLGRASKLTAAIPRHDSVERTLVTFLGESSVQPVAGIFGYIDAKYERPEREVAQKLGHDQFLDAYPTAASRTLNRGLFFTELNSINSLSIPATEAEWLTSLAIDVCNDTGIAVPATFLDEETGLVGRCYRVGENSFLANRLYEKAGVEPTTEVITRCLMDSTTWLMPHFYTAARGLNYYRVESIREEDLGSLANLLQGEATLLSQNV